jgi:hypothetical protein
MSSQIRYTITIGSGEAGEAREERLRRAADIRGLAFSEWINKTLDDAASRVIPVQQK